MNLLEKIIQIRSNNTAARAVSGDNKEFYNTFSEYIKNNSKLLSQSKIINGKQNSWYYLGIEDNSNVITLLGESNKFPLNVQPKKLTGTIAISPKVLGIETKINRLAEDFYEKNNTDIKEIMVNLLYRPFLKSVERCFLTGNYFDKPLFSTTNFVTGTNNFTGLLKLVRELKSRQDDNIIVGNSNVISSIFNSITTVANEPFLIEYLFKGTVEGVPIISTIEAPANAGGNILVGYDPTNVVLLMSDVLEVRKLNDASTNPTLNNYQIFSFINGGDVFESAVALKI
jgi:hypothetical protein